jgi:hypothetical protein
MDVARENNSDKYGILFTPKSWQKVCQKLLRRRFWTNKWHCKKEKGSLQVPTCQTEIRHKGNPEIHFLSLIAA